MKKLKLKLETKESLTKEQMKKISGGYEPDEWICTCIYGGVGPIITAGDCNTAVNTYSTYCVDPGGSWEWVRCGNVQSVSCSLY